MVKKKVVKKKKPVKAKIKSSKKAVNKTRFSSVKLGIVIRNLILFVLLALISWILFKVSGGVWVDIFNFLWIIFAFISVAFFLALLVLLFLKLIKK